MNLRVPIFMKIVLPLVILIVLTVGFSAFRAYEKSQVTGQADLNIRLKNIAELSATQADQALLEDIRVPEDINKEGYQIVKEKLLASQIAGNLVWVGLYYREGDYLYYWVDSAESAVGYPFFYGTVNHWTAINEGTSMPVTYTDEYGSYYGYVAPVVFEDAQGQAYVAGLAEAVVGLESTKITEKEALRNFLPSLIGGILIAVGVTVLLTLLVFDGPLQRLKRGALALAGGELGHTIDLRSHDELTDLAETFNLMSARLAELYGQLQGANRDLEARVSMRTTELREERNRLDAILQNIADGLVVTDAAGKIVLVNPVLMQGLGLERESVIGRQLREIVPSEPLLSGVVQALLHPGEVYTVTLPPLRLNPQSMERVYNVSSCALVQRLGYGESPALSSRPGGVVTVIRDITRETEVDRMKTEFISTVSHELRTPLTSVLGFTKLISKSFERDVAPHMDIGSLKSQQSLRRIQDNLAIIINEAERLTRLINDVLDIAKMEAGKVEWHLSDVAMGNVVESARAAISSQIEAKGLFLDVKCEPGLPTVRADQDRLIQVLTNLLSNSVKFSDCGEILIEARVVRISTEGEVVPPLPGASAHLMPGSWLAVSVRDQGIGIPADQLSEVFQKFKQLGDMMTNRPKGTGLGLAICKEIVEHHRGYIWVESTLGVGSIFVFALPLETMPAPRAVAIEDLRRRLAETFPDGRGGKLVLVVDDEESIRTLLHQELLNAGYRVAEAGNGLEALRQARDENPDLIILDLMMPGINGFDVLSVLKGDAKTAPIPVLILSVLEDRERGLRLGADEYLIKPLDSERLLGTIAGLLERAARGEGRKKVLVIDEDISVVMAIRRVLQERGYEVLEANDGQSGLERARVERPDLIILDGVISRMNDYSVLKALKSDVEAQEALVIVLTATATPEEIATLLEGRGHNRPERLGDIRIGE